MVAEPGRYGRKAKRRRRAKQARSRERAKSQKSTHTQVKRVREMSDLKKYILIWDWLVAFASTPAETSMSNAPAINHTRPRNQPFEAFAPKLPLMI
ncbi:hypothetical protein GE21DRAFT_5289 [Neurospora crassa]|uniref:Uncharacterized protein n=1 Tax=Neurospora crassa (strain ATCC 24698 / 74-OR23-1A / CBS 708.71 / DSM 1257 / FGSC 987) TaxID=367110 RepID=Q7SAX9_NEUCR|nr:hypothetical protein NCU07653 [Neurospora crassa OR74A]EAA33544.1 hypothetical protein NCU07653 [Neurospora crassa OR74A]KHE79896.1 hypothetical protein GE21DRAFT_5289 [Neurospora crassa]|eukprot:XP_962780.1 hypothetical protein NCU07653 [Neurospora crassa OR74A]